MKTYPSKKLVLASLLLGLSQTSWAACDQTLNAGANVANAVSSASNGATICLNAGSYPAFNASISKTSMTTVTAAPGLSQSQVTISSVNVRSSQNLSFVGMTIGGGTSVVSVGGGASSLHIRFLKNKFTGPLCIFTPQNNNQDTLIDGNSFANVGASCAEGRLGVNGNNTTHTVANGVVISNNIFSGSGPSDGIQITGGASGTVIGPGNEFVGIKQSGCGAVHCDPIQFYGATKTTITGNYFHNNSTGLMSPDGNGSPVTITNNVFVTDGEYPDQIVFGYSTGDIIKHNTFANGARIRCGASQSGKCSNDLIRDNIITGGFHFADGQSQSGVGTIDHNLINGATIGSGGINGSPTYIGGNQPTSWSGYQLSSSSKGYKAASDGLDMGANSFGTNVSVNPVTPTTYEPPKNFRQQ